MSVFDIVLTGGRVMDPGSGRDEIANVGISDGTIQAITNEPLEGLDSIDATGLVVAPGAIDMHSHGQDEENYRVQARGRGHHRAGARSRGPGHRRLVR